MFIKWDDPPSTKSLFQWRCDQLWTKSGWPNEMNKTLRIPNICHIHWLAGILPVNSLPQQKLQQNSNTIPTSSRKKKKTLFKKKKVQEKKTDVSDFTFTTHFFLSRVFYFGLFGWGSPPHPHFVPLCCKCFGNESLEVLHVDLDSPSCCRAPGGLRHGKKNLNSLTLVRLRWVVEIPIICKVFF